MDPAAPTAFTNRTRLTLDTEEAAGAEDKLNLTKARVDPALTESSGEEPKLTAGNAELTDASSLGPKDCPNIAPGISSAPAARTRQNLRD
jgi:hypothetical protein